MPRCPSCGQALTRVEGEGGKFMTCSGCFGTWINRAVLNRLAQRDLEEPPAAPGPTADIPQLAAVVTESDTRGLLRCPECPSITLEKQRVHPRIPVNVDACPKCRGIWFDVGELPLFRGLYHEFQTSTDPEVSKLRRASTPRSTPMPGPVSYDSSDEGSGAIAAGEMLDTIIDLLSRC